MAETTEGGRMDDHKDRIAKLEAARREMEDTLVVMAHLETKAAARIRDHAQSLADQEESMKRHRMKMDEFDDKLNALIDIGRGQGGIESRL